MSNAVRNREWMREPMSRENALRVTHGTAFMVKRSSAAAAVGDAFMCVGRNVLSTRANAIAVAIKIWRGNKRWRADPVDGRAWGYLAVVLCGRAKNAQAAAICCGNIRRRADATMSNAVRNREWMREPMSRENALRVTHGTAFMVKRSSAAAPVGDAFMCVGRNVLSTRANAIAVAIKIWRGNKRWRADPADGRAWGYLAVVLCGRAKHAPAAEICCGNIRRRTDATMSNAVRNREWMREPRMREPIMSKAVRNRDLRVNGTAFMVKRNRALMVNGRAMREEGRAGCDALHSHRTKLLQGAALYLRHHTRGRALRHSHEQNNAPRKNLDSNQRFRDACCACKTRHD
jgi:hypothetical protein